MKVQSMRGNQITLGVKMQKVRHQLCRTKDLSARLDGIAKGTGRARSELLVEALEPG